MRKRAKRRKCDQVNWLMAQIIIIVSTDCYQRIIKRSVQMMGAGSNNKLYLKQWF
jgi:hypothetical protein